ncbi:MAG: alpha/beta hydrolase [Cyanobacteria bacterium]|nr:alpha/beta hydrolase [Cyanobacteriota bacterium]
MPIVKESSYKAPWIFQNPHLGTILPSLLRTSAKVDYVRERIITPDNDFLDLDWSKTNSKELAIVCHGLEGSSQSHYINHAVKSLNLSGIDALAMNYRDCSGEPNNLVKSYHSGKTEDLALLIDHVQTNYESIYLIGFSIGGNLVLKYLGEQGSSVMDKIKLGITFAVPLCLEACAHELAKPENAIYMKYFLYRLHRKIKKKIKKFPGQIDDKDFSKLKSFYDYDRAYTAPLNGFKDEYDYWDKASCKKYLDDIKVPSFVINSLDDPFLAGDCYPVQSAIQNDNVFLETSAHGGHMGFASWGDVYWWQERMIEIIALVRSSGGKHLEALVSSSS